MSLTEGQKQRVRERAHDCCEYCRIAQASRMVRFQIDHIIAVSHGGTDDESNLCLACFKCNGYKGPNIAAADPVTGTATFLFNPRTQSWDKHFRLNDDATITGITPEGRTTINVLRINDDGRVIQRLGDIETDDYPCKKE